MVFLPFLFAFLSFILKIFQFYRTRFCFVGSNHLFGAYWAESRYPSYR